LDLRDSAFVEKASVKKTRKISPHYNPRNTGLAGKVGSRILRPIQNDSRWHPSEHQTKSTSIHKTMQLKNFRRTVEDCLPLHAPGQNSRDEIYPNLDCRLKSTPSDKNLSTEEKVLVFLRQKGPSAQI
jgi:hypothetical protein